VAERERIRYRGDSGITIGTFRARLTDPWFHDSGPIDEHIFVFPRTAVTITHAGQRQVVADRNTVMFYNRHQMYRRAPLSAEGDLCDWFRVPDAAVVDAVCARDPSVQDRPERPFRFAAGPCPAAVYARQRQVVAAGPGPDTDEDVLDLLRGVVASAYRARGIAPVPLAPRAAGARRDLVEAARALVAVQYRERLTTAGVAAQLSVSPFHLSRVFKEQTGVGLHQYITQLRLRRALVHLEDPRCSLIEIAIELGFSSHSHFTAAFRQAFRTSPSRLREALGRPATARLARARI
jgi:AraC family transcriptional regulator